MSDNIDYILVLNCYVFTEKVEKPVLRKEKPANEASGEKKPKVRMVDRCSLLYVN